jgi:hypothetical protein
MRECDVACDNFMCVVSSHLKAVPEGLLGNRVEHGNNVEEKERQFDSTVGKTKKSTTEEWINLHEGLVDGGVAISSYKN